MMKVGSKKAGKRVGGRKAAAKKSGAAETQQNATPKKEAEYKPRVWMKAFITTLSLRAIVSHACNAARIDRATAYRAKETDPVFAQAWDEAVEVAADTLEDEAWRRATEGVEKPVGFYQGAAAEYVREYSDVLLMFMLKGARPNKYRENVKLEHGGKLRVVTEKDLSDNELANIAASTD